MVEQKMVIKKEFKSGHKREKTDLIEKESPEKQMTEEEKQKQKKRE